MRTNMMVPMSVNSYVCIGLEESTSVGVSCCRSLSFEMQTYWSRNGNENDVLAFSRSWISVSQNNIVN